jgi:hypothetical protein
MFSILKSTGNSVCSLARPWSGSKLPRDYTSVTEVTKDENTNHDNLLEIKIEHTVFSCLKPAVLCQCIQHLLSQTKVAVLFMKKK